MESPRRPGLRRALALAVLAAGALAALFGPGAQAAVLEVKLSAQRAGWARIHAEGLWIDGCTGPVGPCTWDTSAGPPETRRVRVHRGANRIRVKAFRWEWEEIPLSEQLGRMLGSDGSTPLVRAPLNAVHVEGRIAGVPFARTVRKD